MSLKLVDGFAESLAYTLNTVFKPLRIHQNLLKAKQTLEANWKWAYDEIHSVHHIFGEYWDLEGKRTLDIGCGLGGKIPFYLQESGSTAVIALDISFERLAQAEKHPFVQSEMHSNASRLHLLNSDASNLPFKKDSFDRIVSINTFEHILDLEEAIRDSLRVLKPGGLALLFLPPYYSPWGPHLENWIHYPWPHVFFSERTLIKVVKRIERESLVGDKFLPSARIPWEDIKDTLPSLNKVTIYRLMNIIKRTNFEIRFRKFLPLGYHTLRSGSLLQKMLYYLFLSFSKLPLIRELLVTKMAIVLEKPRLHED